MKNRRMGGGGGTLDVQACATEARMSRPSVVPDEITYQVAG